MERYLIKKTKKSKDEEDKEFEIDLDINKEKVKKQEMFVGAHLSISGGLKSTVIDACGIGAKSFAMFLCNQKSWESKPLNVDVANEFQQTCQIYGFESHLILPHGSYLINCGSPNDEVLKKSKKLLIDGFKRCEMLNIKNYNFHPGSTCGKISVKESLKKIAESINEAHSVTNSTVAENMSKQGNTVGGDFKELKEIIDQVKDKSRVGVCLDTCHAFASGYNLANQKGYQKMMHDFETIIGFDYLKAIHLNDSKGVVNSHLDRHENIGKGKIGIEGFKFIMNEPRFKNIPIILETPYVDGIYRKEIELLYNLINEA